MSFNTLTLAMFSGHVNRRCFQKSEYWLSSCQSNAPLCVKTYIIPVVVYLYQGLLMFIKDIEWNIHVSSNIWIKEG
jgi:hypothetical protein